MKSLLDISISSSPNENPSSTVFPIIAKNSSTISDFIFISLVLISFFPFIKSIISSISYFLISLETSGIYNNCEFKNSFNSLLTFTISDSSLNAVSLSFLSPSDTNSILVSFSISELFFLCLASNNFFINLIFTS